MLAPLLPLPPGEGWSEGKPEKTFEQQARRSQFSLTPSLSRRERGQHRASARDILCGGLAGVLFYKPQLALAVAIALVLTRGWRAMLGLAITGTLLLLFTLWQMPGTLGAFLHSLPPTIHWMRTALPYNWGRQVTPQSFWRLIIEGHVIGETSTLPKALGIVTALGFAGMLA
ncbi:MAG TPA: glycosyltransferase 87 family protein, partial [Tepidisphaeraceae bacterium]|nr:glycosyltransferase 87 family protein [Tepidisphaeraceae bacterium]